MAKKSVSESFISELDGKGYIHKCFKCDMNMSFVHDITRSRSKCYHCGTCDINMYVCGECVMLTETHIHVAILQIEGLEVATCHDKGINTTETIFDAPTNFIKTKMVKSKDQDFYDPILLPCGKCGFEH